MKMPRTEVDGEVTVRDADFRRLYESNLKHSAFEARTDNNMCPILDEQFLHQVSHDLFRWRKITVRSDRVIGLLLNLVKLYPVKARKICGGRWHKGSS